ncbi:32811_t:CDS:2, partial [Gigaspora margarita]
MLHKAIAKKKEYSRTIFLYNKAKQEDWERYRVELYKRITRVGAVKKWLIDKNPIVEDEMKAYSKKKIHETRATRDGKKRLRLDKLIIELDRWVRKGKRKIERDMTKEDRKDFGLFRENIRKKFQIKIENIGKKWEDKNIEDLSDGSLVRTLTEKRGIDRMEASWVQVGLDKEEILDTGYV